MFLLPYPEPPRALLLPQLPTTTTPLLGPMVQQPQGIRQAQQGAPELLGSTLIGQFSCHTSDGIFTCHPKTNPDCQPLLHLSLGVWRRKPHLHCSPRPDLGPGPEETLSDGWNSLVPIECLPFSGVDKGEDAKKNKTWEFCSQIFRGELKPHFLPWASDSVLHASVSSSVTMIVPTSWHFY